LSAAAGHQQVEGRRRNDIWIDISFRKRITSGKKTEENFLGIEWPFGKNAGYVSEREGEGYASKDSVGGNKSGKSERRVDRMLFDLL
jgi:hypothetical protein